jgi:hypothetical protein
MKKIFLILSLIFIWSIIFYIFKDNSQKIWMDSGIVGIFVYLIGRLGDFISLIIALIVFFLLFFLRKNNKIQLNNSVLFLFGYLINFMILTFISLFFMSVRLLKINIELFTGTVFVTLIHSLISFYVMEYFLIKKNQKKRR